MINHAPIFGISIATALLLVGAVRNSRDLKRFALGLFVVLGVATGAAFLTGEPAEEWIEHLPGVSEHLIEEHEESAKFGLIGALILAGLSTIALTVRSWALESRLQFLALLAAVAGLTLATLGWISNLGGQIRHPEIRGAEAPASQKALDDDSQEH